MKTARLLLTAGEPAGIGPDILIQAAQTAWPAELVALADPQLLQERAKTLNLPLKLEPFDAKAAPQAQAAGTLKILPLSLAVSCEAGKLDKANAAYVIQSLEKACELASQQVGALVTGPVHKGILNEAGFEFSGHTEFFAEKTGADPAVMLFVTPKARIALATTHLPLVEVSKAITPLLLEKTLRILHQALRERFGVKDPLIYVSGLNPHAGEGGHLGREELACIIPVLEKLRLEKFRLEGPLSADTLFSEKNFQKADAFLAMFHDQALPVVKTLSFYEAVNVTLGLPFIRTSVDHGTALELAGTGKAAAASLKAAMNLAIQLAVMPAKAGTQES